MPSDQRFVIGIRISEDERRKALKGDTGHSRETQYDLAKRIGESMGGTLATDLGVTYHVKRYGEPKRGVRLPGAYVDDGGKSWAVSKYKRPALMVMIKDAAAGKFDIIVWAYPERMTRLPDDFALLYRIFKKFRVTLNLGGQVMSDREIASMRSRMDWMEESIRDLRKKTNDALHKIVKGGGKLGRTPIGLIRTADNRGYELDPIGTLVEQHVAQGLKPEEITARLPAFRAPGSLKSRRLSASGVSRVIQNIEAWRAGTLDGTISKRLPKRYDCPVEWCGAKDVRKHEHEWWHEDLAARKEAKDWLEGLAPDATFEFQ